MKNIQVIDGANNFTYSLFSATDAKFDSIFPNDTNIEFAEDFFDRVGEARGVEITQGIWQRPVKKHDVQGYMELCFTDSSIKSVITLPGKNQSSFH